MAAAKAQNGSNTPAASERPSTSTTTTMPAGAAATAGGTAPRVIMAGEKGRILCVADIRGDYHELNKLIREHEATAVIHVGDFGFMEAESVPRMSDKIIRHILQYSPLLPPTMRTHLLSLPSTGANARQSLIEALNNSSIHFPLSQFPHLLSGAITFPVPVFTVYGLIEDVRVLEKFRTGEYEVHNLHVIDEVGTRCLEAGGVRLRLFGLGGAMAMHKLFDCGEGSSTIAGAQGTMWSTALQIGELLETAQKVYDPSETRVFIASSAVGRNGIFSQICRAIKADLTISAGLHFRYTVSFNEHSVCTDFAEYQQKLVSANSDLNGVYSSVREKVDATMTEYQHGLLRKVLDMAGDIPDRESEERERSMTNIWHWTLSDTSCGQMVLALGEGRVSAEVKSTGLNFSHRVAQTPAPPSAPSITPAIPSSKAPADVRPSVSGAVPAGPRGAVGPASSAATGTGSLPRPPQGTLGAQAQTQAPFANANGIRPNFVRPPNAARGPAGLGATTSGPGQPTSGPITGVQGGAGTLSRPPHNPTGPGFNRPARPVMGGGGAGANAGPAGPIAPGMANQRPPPSSGLGGGNNVRPPRPGPGQGNNASPHPGNLSSANAQPIRPNPRDQQAQQGALGKAPASVPSKPGTPSKGPQTGPKDKEESNKRDIKNASSPAPAPAAKKDESKPSTPAAAPAAAASATSAAPAPSQAKEKEANTSVTTAGADNKSGSISASETTSGLAHSASQEGQARPPRNKWSLFVRGLPVPVTEQELKDAFGDSKSKIQSVKLVFDHFVSRKQKNIAYVDFANEEDMNDALKAEVKIKDTVLSVIVSNPPARQPREEAGRGGRGGSRGGVRGGRGGGRGGAPGLGRKDSEGGAGLAGGEKKEGTPGPTAGGVEKKPGTSAAAGSASAGEKKE